jgi:hypothetical protein
MGNNDNHTTERDATGERSGAKIAFDIIVALFAIVGGLYAAITWVMGYFSDLQRVHIELRLDSSNCTANNGKSIDAKGAIAPVIEGFRSICLVQVDVHNIGSVDFTARGDAVFFVCQSNPLRRGERALTPYVKISGPIRVEPVSGSPRIDTYADNIVQLSGNLPRGSHVNLRFTAYARASDNAGIALKPYPVGVVLAADTPPPADPSLCRNGETD